METHKIYDMVKSDVVGCQSFKIIGYELQHKYNLAEKACVPEFLLLL